MKPLKHTLRSAAIAAMLLVTALPAFPQGPRGPRTPVAVAPASEDEIKWLKFMREEEKLALDVYRFLYERWNVAIFDRIAQSESQHFASVGTLLTRYSVADPASEKPGVFSDERLAVLYADLTAKGAASLKDALEVGVLIENQDISDLVEALQTEKLDIKRVYNNLMTASFNHLDAFESSLDLLASLDAR